MAAAPDATLYVRLRKRIAISPGEQVKLGSVSRMLSEAGVEKQLAGLEIYRHKPEDGNRVVIDMLHIIRLIHTVKPGLAVEYYGDPQVLVMIDMKAIKPRITVLLLAWLLLFFGAGLAIMNFHADVSMREVHVRITELITGSADTHPLWFQIPYSVGIGLGMSLFFNHIFRKRFNEEPSPLEVELYTYQENVNAYVIADEMGKMNGDDRSRADE
ncbi:stage V sporulation protein AA [Paenibacillus tarimensis]|uniref:stage V sporulation protein AA n=1 Tax=Paenibacillus tarimensis TaxID=416012 RepID=UPI001F3B8207|nr:stage V sporulation protein AA [Paenibacillus tarimensis]MCF2942483.1 stage V sporulation protein AA [Paenibacillus tarimensis]